MYFAPAYPVKKVKDPTGAGDSFAGAFMGYLADHDFVNHTLIKEAILYGTVLAAMNVSDFSVQGLVGKSMSEIDNYKDRLIKWTS
jgi:ribokinase